MEIKSSAYKMHIEYQSDLASFLQVVDIVSLHVERGEMAFVVMFRTPLDFDTLLKEIKSIKGGQVMFQTLAEI